MRTWKNFLIKFYRKKVRIVINFLLMEQLKTKRTIIRKLVWLMPMLVFIITVILFSTTGYVVESAINQWSFLWLNVFIALEIGLIDHHEKSDTQYKMIISAPINLAKFELGRILHGIFILFGSSIVFIIVILASSFLIQFRVSLLNCIVAVIGIMLTSLWEVPMYTWLSHKTNLYITVIIAFIGSFIGISIVALPWGSLFPFTWSALFPVSFTKMNINGTLATLNSNSGSYYYTLYYSIILMLLLSIGTSWSFKKEVS